MWTFTIASQGPTSAKPVRITTLQNAKSILYKIAGSEMKKKLVAWQNQQHVTNFFFASTEVSPTASFSYSMLTLTKLPTWADKVHVKQVDLIGSNDVPYSETF